MTTPKLSLRIVLRALVILPGCAFVGIWTAPAADFRITSILPTNYDIRLTWNAPGGSNYVVQSASRFAITNSNTNFLDLSPAILVPGSGIQATSYTHIGGRANGTNRFYRIRAFPIPQSLRIEPTNAVIGVGMTNRYKVFAIYGGNNTQDVTAEATVTSLSSGAQVVTAANGFARVRGQSVGTAMIRAVFQDRSNTVSLTVGRLLGLSTDPPPFNINDYVSGSETSVKVMGQFSNGQTVNITPSSNLENSFGGEPVGTRLSYNVAADVANSFALISGQSAAAGELVFTATDEFGSTLTTSSFRVNWCWFTSITLLPQNTQISVGRTQQFSVVGMMANGMTTNTSQVTFVNAFTSSDAEIAEPDLALRVAGRSPGDVTVEVNLNNGPGEFCLNGLSASATVTVGFPPAIINQPASQTVLFGNNASFSFTASGAAPTFYQWQFNNVNISGATNGSLNISNITYAQEGDYRVVLTNAYGAVASASARLTVKNPSGAVLWINRYHGPTSDNDAASAVAVDNVGNAYVTGTSRGTFSLFDSDYATIKYSGAGVALWTNRYNGPGNDLDAAKAMVVDDGGNVLITGASWGAGSGDDYATIKYSSAGVPLWGNRYSGPAASDQAQAIAMDGNGNVFVTGRSSGTGSGYDYTTIKYSSTGESLWTNRYNGPGNSDDNATAIKVDNSGDVILTGYSRSSGSLGSEDYVTIKYSGSGLPLWTNRYNGPGSDYDAANAVAVDADGNVIVTGYSYGTNGYYDYSTLKYSSFGVALWTNRYNGAGNGFAAAKALAVERNGDVYVTGRTGFSFDYATVKYSSEGVPLWTNRYNGPANGNDEPTAVALDAVGNAFVTGRSRDDYATVAYSSAGVPLWTNLYTGSGNSSDQANAIAVDRTGNVFVTGSAKGNGSATDYATIKYGSTCFAPNDNFFGRILLTGASVATNAVNACASKEAGEPDHGGNPGGKSVWWSWTASMSGPVMMSTCGSGFDTLLAVYAGSAVNALTLVPGGSNDDNVSGCGIGSLQSQVQFNATAGTTYQIAVDGHKGPDDPTPSSGNVLLTIQQ